VIPPASRISRTAAVQGDIQDGQAAAGTGRAAVWCGLPSARLYALIRGWALGIEGGLPASGTGKAAVQGWPEDSKY